MRFLGLLVILPLGAVAGWAIVRIFLWLHRGNFGHEWLRAYSFLIAIGMVVGIWFAFFSQYSMAGRQLHGFPIPVEILSREKPSDPWVASDMPTVIRLAGWAADTLFGVALCLAPLAIGAFFKENRGKHEFAASPPPNRGNRA